MSAAPPKKIQIDAEYLKSTLLGLLEIPSPTGYTDVIVHHLCDRLGELGLEFELTRRGAIRAHVRGKNRRPARAIVAHLDTLGAMVKSLKKNGRLELVSIGTWSSRFAEGARVTIFTDEAGAKRGTILPLKASGHAFGNDVDTQPTSWEHVELRPDEACESEADLARAGFAIGDFIAIDPCPELAGPGFINSRHLDDKAGVACMMAAAKAVRDSGAEVPVDCHLLFTISEEVGTGASAVLHGEIAELVAVDNAVPAPGQNSRERGVTVAMADSTGPFDYYLTRKLLTLCREQTIEHQRDVFRHYRCDAASALEAGNDIRFALVGYGVDASHGYERTNLAALLSTSELLATYIASGPTIPRDKLALGPIDGFPTPEETPTE
jgi:peptidase M42 family hydrolase